MSMPPPAAVLSYFECRPTLHLHAYPLQMDHRKKDGPSSAQNVRAFKKMLVDDWEELPWCFETSGKTGLGKSELLGYIASINEMYQTSDKS